MAGFNVWAVTSMYQRYTVLYTHWAPHNLAKSFCVTPTRTLRAPNFKQKARVQQLYSLGCAHGSSCSIIEHIGLIRGFSLPPLCLSQIMASKWKGSIFLLIAFCREYFCTPMRMKASLRGRLSVSDVPELKWPDPLAARWLERRIHSQVIQCVYVHSSPPFKGSLLALDILAASEYIFNDNWSEKAAKKKKLSSRTNLTACKLLNV